MSVVSDRDKLDTTIGPDGMQTNYLVLSEEERAKGFIRPVCHAYRHDKCGAVTTMGQALAETYARDIYFYSGTFCSHCRAHFPVGPQGEFTWIPESPAERQLDGRKVGT